MSTISNPANYAYCEDLLRQQDKDRWLACLFIPAEARPHIHALYAFNLEIARVSETVSDPLLGEIRLQWWRDVLEEANTGDAQANPPTAALLDTIEAFGLPKAPLLKLIDARLSRDIYGDRLGSVNELESYVEATCANLFRLCMLIAAGAGAQEDFSSAYHAGIAYGITGLMRALPWHCARDQVYVPEDILAKRGVRREQLIGGEAGDETRAALADLRAIARKHLEAAFSELRSLMQKSRPVLLPISLCEPYLRLMETALYDPFKTIVELPQWKKQWILWRAARNWG